MGSKGWPVIKGDPRNPEGIQAYKKVPVKEEDQDPDFRALASLGLGMAGLFTKVSTTTRVSKRRRTCPCCQHR